MILLHPRIHTFHPDLCTPANPWGTVQGLHVEGGRLVAAGDRDTIARRSSARRYDERFWADLGVAAILPGLIDTHAHLHGLGLRLDALSMPLETPPGGWADAVRRVLADRPRPPGAWLEGRGWDQSAWAAPAGSPTSEGFPTHHALSAAAPETPVILHRVDRHAVWVNAAAMRAAGIDPEAPAPDDPPGGRIVRTAAGLPGGVFVDNAADLITDALPEPSHDELVEIIRASARRFLAHGVTCVHCALIEPRHLDAYREALSGPDAPGLRVRGMVWDKPDALAEWAESHGPWGSHSDAFAVTTLKAFADGALGSRGAWLLEPYADRPDETGFPLATPDEIARLGAVAARRGWQLATHAIGDRAVRETLNAYARAASPETIRALRWRVEHLQHTTAEDLAHAAALGVYAAMQPIHCTSDMRFALQRLGAERCRLAYPWRAARAAGLTLGYGSDWPIDDLNPFAGLHAALTRQRPDHQPPGGFIPEQRDALPDALRAWTTEAAALSPTDADHLGYIGAVDDLIALSHDPTTATAEQLLATRVRWGQAQGRPLPITIDD